MYQGQPAMEYWEATQKVLQGDPTLVRRPRLTEALLKKPPFRFLHDIVTEVCRQTGFAGGLFTPEEQISSNMKDKESKVAYLWKIINCVGITLNAHVPARPLKIVSGMEPEQTNTFLQMLAAATTIDSPARQRAVSKVLAGEKMPSPEQGTMEWAHRLEGLSSEGHEHPKQALDSHFPCMETKTGCVLPGMKEGGASIHRSAEESMAASLLGIPNEMTGREEMDRFSVQNIHHVGNPTSVSSTPQPLPFSRENSSGKVTPAGASRRPEEKLVKAEVIEPLITLTSTDEAWPPLVQSQSDANVKNCSTPHQNMLDMPPSTARTETLPPAARPMTVGGNGRGNFNAWTARLDTLGGFPSFAARPQSARKGPPKIHNSLVTAEKAPPKIPAAAPSEMVPSPISVGAGGKEILGKRRPSILLDREVQEDDESDALPVLIPAQQHPLPEALVVSVGSGKSFQFSASSEAAENAVGKADDGSVEEQDMIVGAIEATKEDAQSRQEEVQKLREMVQTMCQATIPLGKSMDYLQEDEEAMNKEHQFWIKERNTYSARLDEEKRITDEMLQAETGRILELEEEIQYYRQKITSTKAHILRNNDAIMSSLRMVTTRQLK